MKLKRLIIQGFKSFKERQTIHFDDGITGIVGPNGCGKSNIVDALFWVMGEQSAKHLRGKSMKDLIFAGSSKYSPGSFAEATLVLENTGGKHIHIGNKVGSPAEIQLTRKLYRNGETEYRINGEPCRLRDIQEVFMDTGAGAKSYSIIAQGEINRLVQAKPVERRVMIEEVAGITKFKMRKRESMRKIDATQLNLNRLNDLQSEIEKNLSSLRKQAEKAERARSLKDKIRRNDLTVSAHKVFEHLRILRDDQTVIEEKNANIEIWKTEKDNLEISLEDERHKKVEQTAKIEVLQDEYNEISKQLAAAEEKLKHLCASQTEKESQVETREKEISELCVELENREQKLKELKNEREKLELQREEGFDFSSLEEEVEIIKIELEEKKEELSMIQDKLTVQREDLNEVEQTVFRNNSRMEEFANTLQDITEEIEAVETQYSGLSKSIADERDAVHQASEKVVALENNEQSLRVEIGKAQTEYKKNNETLQNKTKELIQTESKLLSLREINASLEGAKDGASAYLKETQDEKLKLVGSLIQSEESYAKGVQTLLGDLMNVLVSSGDDCYELLNWIKDNKEKGIDLFIPGKSQFSSETVERLRLNGLEKIISLKEIIEIPDVYKNRLEEVLEGFYLIPTLSQEQFNSIDSDIQFKAIASFDGQIMIKNLGGGKVLDMAGESDPAQGIVERNNRIKELDSSLDILTLDVKNLEEKVISEKVILEELQVKHDSLRDELSQVKSDSAAKSSALESKLANMESGNSRLDILKNRKTEISKSRLELLESEEELGNRKENLGTQVEDLNTRFEELNETLDFQQSTYSEKREELLEKQVQAKSFEERFKGVDTQIVDIEGQLERQNGRIETNRSLVTQLNEDIVGIEESLQNVESSNNEKGSELEEKEEVLNLLKDNLGELLQEMQKREENVKELTEKINKTEKHCVELETKLTQALVEEEQQVRDTFEKYQVDLRDSIGRHLEYQEEDYKKLGDITSMFFIESEEGTREVLKEEYEFSRRYGNDLKEVSVRLKQYKTEFNRLGEINWQAIEDFERQKLRHDFLKVQESELKQSLEDLEKAITHIDEKSRERFKIAFSEVDVRFKKVFPIIFGGGNAELKIIGDINDAECGVEIIAQPPGKKMQNINLMSGGEKALTAVSLIFSIFLVKPSPFCLLDEVDAPLDDANVGRFNELLREMSEESQFILITHNKKTMELNDTLYGVTMQEPGVSKAVSVQLH